MDTVLKRSYKKHLILIKLQIDLKLTMIINKERAS
jgi:hypothetical protein